MGAPVSIERQRAVIAARRRYRLAKIEMTIASRELAKLSPADAPPAAHPAIQAVQRIVADYYRIEVASLWGSFRGDPYVTARQQAMTIVRRLTRLHLVEIGVAFNRDHAVVLHSERTVAERCAQTAHYHNDFEAVLALCKAAIEGKA